MHTATGVRLLTITAHIGLVNTYGEVYKDSQRRESPSVKISVRNGNYRRKDAVGIRLTTSDLNCTANKTISNIECT